MTLNKKFQLILLVGFTTVLAYLYSVKCNEYNRLKIQVNDLSEKLSENDNLLNEYQTALGQFMQTDSGCAYKFMQTIELINEK